MTTPETTAAETAAPAAPKPLSRIEELKAFLTSALADQLVDATLAHGELSLRVQASNLTKVLLFLRDDPRCAFRQLMDVSGVDYLGRAQRFDVIYQLLSVTQNQRVTLKIATDERTPVPSVVALYPAAGWFEREVWDMYGVLFSGNPDLRRILTDYGFDGHPLRKDFPLTGYVEVRYDDTQKRVVYEPVKLNQAFRNFDYLSPWEKAEYVLPGDEKATAS
jgi:NADH-quinone oxidoreductase subunit C